MNESLLFKQRKYEALLTAIDAGISYGKIRFYSAPMPTTPDTAITSQVLMADVSLQSPAGYYNSSTHHLVFYNPTPSAFLANGTITWCRILDGDDNALLDISIGTSGTDIIWATPIAEVGKNLTIDSFVLQ